MRISCLIAAPIALAGCVNTPETIRELPAKTFVTTKPIQPTIDCVHGLWASDSVYPVTTSPYRNGTAVMVMANNAGPIVIADHFPTDGGTKIELRHWEIGDYGMTTHVETCVN